MGKIRGSNTKAVAEGLKDKLESDPQRYKGLKIFYDHGKSSRAEVCQPTAYMGRRYGSDATLAAVDIVVTKGKDVLLAIEIEESMYKGLVFKGVTLNLSAEVVGPAGGYGFIPNNARLMSSRT
jgi:hypothetical protein